MRTSPATAASVSLAAAVVDGDNVLATGDDKIITYKEKTQQVKKITFTIFSCRCHMLNTGMSQQCATLSECRRSHTFHCLSDQISCNTCYSGPVLSENDSTILLAK